jgi:hypothetical protein
MSVLLNRAHLGLLKPSKQAAVDTADQNKNVEESRKLTSVAMTVAN